MSEGFEHGDLLGCEGGVLSAPWGGARGMRDHVPSTCYVSDIGLAADRRDRAVEPSRTCRRCSVLAGESSAVIACVSQVEPPSADYSLRPPISARTLSAACHGGGLDGRWRRRAREAAQLAIETSERQASGCARACRSSCHAAAFTLLIRNTTRRACLTTCVATFRTRSRSRRRDRPSPVSATSRHRM